jgi:hypothetical protein
MDPFNIIAGCASILGFSFALYEYFKRKKLEQFTLNSLQGLAGNLAKVAQSTEWASANFTAVQNDAINLPDSEIKKSIIMKATLGTGDTFSADRMVKNLFNELLTLQESQFGTRLIKHQEAENFSVYKKEEH